MTNPSISQSQKRFNESIGALFATRESPTPPSTLFLKSSTDTGVVRNGGRNGARFAPQSLLAALKKFSQAEALRGKAFHEYEVSSEEQEKSDFHQSQMVETEVIFNLIQEFPNASVYHLGGGHDHIYPLLRAYSRLYQKIVVINVDAHADTRTDKEPHSGTPFRQFAEEFQGEFRIFQIGLHPFANSFSTLEPLGRGKRFELWRRDFSEDSLNALFKKVGEEISAKTLTVFSLDADALAGYEVPGVSAVNPSGLSHQDLLKIWKRYQELELCHSPVVGIYELNPVYDTLASLSMRTMASFIFEGL